MTELKEMMETQLINLRGRLSSRGLSGAIRDIEQISSLAGLTNSRDQGITSELLTDAGQTVRRNIVRLHRDFLYKVKEINDQIKAKQDSVTAALTKVAVFNEMLAGVKENKRNLNKVQLVGDLFSKIKTTFVQVDNEWKKNGTQKAVDKTLDSLPRLIKIGVSLFSSSTANNEREIKNKIERSLKAVRR